MRIGIDVNPLGIASDTMAAYAYGYSSTKANITHKLLLKLSCKRAQKVIAISQACKEDIVRYMGIDPGKIQVVYNGIRCSDLSALPLGVGK